MFEPRRGSVDCEIKEGGEGGGTKRRNKTILVIESDRYRKQLTFDQNPSWMAGNFAAGNLSRSRLFAFSSHDFKSPPHPDVTRSNGETHRGKDDANIFSIIPGVSARRRNSSTTTSSHHLSLSFLLFRALRNRSLPRVPRLACVFPLSFPSFLSSRRRNHRSQGTFDIQITPT